MLFGLLLYKKYFQISFKRVFNLNYVNSFDDNLSSNLLCVQSLLSLPQRPSIGNQSFQFNLSDSILVVHVAPVGITKCNARRNCVDPALGGNKFARNPTNAERADTLNGMAQTVRNVGFSM